MPIEPVEVLLVEDDPGDIRLTQESLKESKLKVALHIATDGLQAMDYLRRTGDYGDAKSPDVILLDLNMPKKDGREVLAEIKSDDHLKQIPVLILTTSDADEDILKTYGLGCNCYITKPVGLEQFEKVVKAIESFWFTVVKLPSQV